MTEQEYLEKLEKVTDELENRLEEILALNPRDLEALRMLVQLSPEEREKCIIRDKIH